MTPAGPTLVFTFEAVNEGEGRIVIPYIDTQSSKVLKPEAFFVTLRVKKIESVGS